MNLLLPILTDRPTIIRNTRPIIQILTRILPIKIRNPTLLVMRAIPDIADVVEPLVNVIIDDMTRVNLYHDPLVLVAVILKNDSASRV